MKGVLFRGLEQLLEDLRRLGVAVPLEKKGERLGN
jgi:hypothetical protein